MSWWDNIDFSKVMVKHKIFDWEGTVKVVINDVYGGFGLSKEAMVRYHEIKGVPLWVEEDKKYGTLGIVHYWLVPPEERINSREHDFHSMTLEERKAYNEAYSKQTIYERDFERDDPVLVQVVEELGEKANGKHASLKVVEIPDDVDWTIEEYDGNEWVAEVHRTWS